MGIAGDLHIGCAGWGLRTDQADLFRSEGTHLQRYAGRFGAVEINSSFYRPHQPKTYARWAASVPDGFRFAVKFPRSVTHDARLRDAAVAIGDFATQVEALGDRLGPVLVQLPPSLAYDAAVASAFFEAMRARLDGPIVCEPRHATWFEPDVDALWSRFAVSRVAADPARVPAASLTAGAGPVRYWRLHGSPRVYYDAYGEARLQPWADAIAAERAAGHDCWVILDNTALGHAVHDAVQLEAMLRGAAAADQSWSDAPQPR